MTPSLPKTSRGSNTCYEFVNVLGESSRVCVPAPHSASAQWKRGCWFCCPNLPWLRTLSCGEHSSVPLCTAFDDEMVMPSSNAGGRVFASCAAENIREFKTNECDDDMVTPSSKAGESGESGLLEVIESDFSSPLSDSKCLSINACHFLMLCFLLPARGPAAALVARCSAPSSAAVWVAHA